MTDDVDAGLRDKVELTKWLGLVVGGSAGILTFLGINGNEAGSLLRNESTWRPTLVAGLILAAVVAGTLAALVGNRTISVRAGGAILLLVVGAMVLATVLLPITGQASSNAASKDSRPYPVPVAGRSQQPLLWPVLIVLVVGATAAFLKLRTRRSQRRNEPRVSPRNHVLLDRRLPLGAVLLLASIGLTAAGAYGGLRLEARSQAANTKPQVDVLYSPSKTTPDIVTIKVRAAKVRSADHLAVSVLGLPVAAGRCPDRIPGSADATTTTSPSCLSAPCQSARLKVPCKFLGGSVLRPDATGKVESEFQVPIQSSAYLDLSVLAGFCGSRADCGVFDPKDQTSIDIVLP